MNVHTDDLILFYTNKQLVLNIFFLKNLKYKNAKNGLNIEYFLPALSYLNLKMIKCFILN